MDIIKPETKHGIVHRFPTTTCFKYNGWPSVCTDDRGVLYAVASSMRMSHVDPTGKNCMYVSFNEGETWTPPIVVNDSFFDDRDTGITYVGNGKMVMSWFSLAYDDYCDPIQTYDWFGDGDKAISKGFGDMWRTLPEDVFKGGTGAFVKTSDDYGVTWSEPIRVPLTAPHGPSVCKDGTLVYMGKAMGGDYEARGHIVVYSSKDAGNTWEHTGTVPCGEDCVLQNMHEPHVIELPNGRLLGAIRVHERKTDPMLSIYTTFSDDKGKTWTVPKCIGVDGLPPHLLLHSSGAIICSYACRTDGNHSERAVVSYDNGETWTEDYCLYDFAENNVQQKDMGYPASVELSDGSILTVYYQCLPGQWHTSVLYTKWRLNGK